MSIVKLNNNGVKNATAFGSITGLGDLIFIKRQTSYYQNSITLPPPSLYNLKLG